MQLHQSSLTFHIRSMAASLCLSGIGSHPFTGVLQMAIVLQLETELAAANVAMGKVPLCVAYDLPAGSVRAVTSCPDAAQQRVRKLELARALIHKASAVL